MKEAVQRVGAIIIGDEIVSGDVQDLNGAYLAKQLTELGASLDWVLQCKDNLEDIVSALMYMSGHVECIVLSGGLGPTEDDITAPAVAKWAQVPLERNQVHFEALKAHFGSRMNNAQAKQADIPKGAERIESLRGSACPFMLTVQKEKKLKVISLPGVPLEFQELWVKDGVSFVLGGKTKSAGFEQWYTFGIGEGDLQELCEKAISDCSYRPPLGFLITPQGVDVKLRERSSERNADARGRLDRALAPYTYSKTQRDLAKLCVEELKKQRKYVACAESCTGGLLTQLISRVPGASEVLMGGVVSYSNTWKVDFVGVDPAVIEKSGAVSSDVATQMVMGLEQKTSADIFISITGIAGPTGGTREKPVGTVWIGIKKRGEPARTRQFFFYGGRVAIQRRSAQAALFMLWKELYERN